MNSMPTPIMMIEENSSDLEQELAWFARVIDVRFQLYFNNECEYQTIQQITPPDLATSNSAYGRFVSGQQLNFNERITLILALIPALRPQLLDIFHTKNSLFDRKFTEFGGALDQRGDFIPTIETLIFILAGSDLSLRSTVQSMFERDHLFIKQQILHLSNSEQQDSLIKQTLRISNDYLSRLTRGQPLPPTLSADFPARQVKTELAWSELVLHPGTLTQVQEIEIWLRHGNTLMHDWAMGHKLRPGYRALFYGPPGTGKTITACLLGKSTNREVYKIDLSLVVSKYIGETEKNLARIFDLAQHKEWILFFDEADALFGKRGDTQNANDRHANQEIAFLLQRIEEFDGIAILASNLKDNIDPAFARRFEAMIYFPVPRKEERLRLWQQGFSSKATLATEIELDTIAQQHELSGGAIMNVVRYTSLQAIEQGDNLITLETLQRGIRREQIKMGKGA